MIPRGGGTPPPVMSSMMASRLAVVPVSTLLRAGKSPVTASCVRHSLAFVEKGKWGVGEPSIILLMSLIWSRQGCNC